MSYCFSTFGKIDAEDVATLDDAWMSANAERISKLVKFVRSDSVIEKSIYDCTWVSGCCTMVYPITVFATGDIDFQMKGGRSMNDYRLRGVIARIKRHFADIVHGCYSDAESYDGSCPVSFRIYLRNHFLAKPIIKEVAA